jgi:hypothetical protein
MTTSHLKNRISNVMEGCKNASREDELRAAQGRAAIAAQVHPSLFESHSKLIFSDFSGNVGNSGSQNFQSTPSEELRAMVSCARPRPALPSLPRSCPLILHDFSHFPRFFGKLIF